MPGTIHKDSTIIDKGVFWIRKQIDLNGIEEKENYNIHFGRIGGLADFWVNGEKVGSNSSFLRSDNLIYLPTGLLKNGVNNLVIRIVDKSGTTHFEGPTAIMKIVSAASPTIFFPIVKQWEVDKTLDLSELDKLILKEEPSPPLATVSSIYNAKISPLVNFPIKGFLWYQGENDTSVAEFYQKLFKTFIQDWRKQFGQGELPFLFVQLPNYNNPIKWTEMRAAQFSALELPHTGMAVTIDVGNPVDIHPHHKKPVGYRLANAALNKVYSLKGFDLCPVYDSYKVKSDGIHVFYRDVVDGLVARSGEELNGFTIAGDDEEFTAANAKIIGKNEILIRSDKVPNPVAVRYAWKSNPIEANLISIKGSPASPFRTDSWKLTTAGKIDIEN